MHAIDDVESPRYGLQQDPYDVTFEPFEDYFLDTGSLHYEVVFSMGAGVTSSDMHGICNNVLYSLFDTIETRLNDQLVSTCSGNYAHYKAFLRNILSLEPHNPRLEAFGLFEQVERRGILSGEDINIKGDMKVCGPLLVDLADCDNYLAPGNTISFRFHKAANQFFVTSNDLSPEGDLSFTIKSLKVFARRLQLQPDRLDRILSPGREERYLCNHTQLTPVEISKGTRHLNHTLVQQDVLPKNLVLGLVFSDAFSGDYERDPFRFHAYQLKSLHIVVNGERMPYSSVEPLSIHAYYQLLVQSGKIAKRENPFISYKSFKERFPLHVFDLSAGQHGMAYTQPGKKGQLRIEIEWADDTPRAYTLVCLSSYHQVVTIDPTTKVIKTTLF